MQLTIDVPEKIAVLLADIPEGEARNRQAAEWLERGLDRGAFADREIAQASVYTDEQDALIAEGIAASDAGRTRPAMDSFIDFLKRRDADRKVAPQHGVK